MSRTRICGQVRRELGVYLLGAIGPADRSAVESHLTSCAGCRAQLAELAGLPALLLRVPVEDVASLGRASGTDADSTPPEGSLGSLLSQVVRRRRYRVRSQLAVVTAAALTAGGAAAYALLGTHEQRPGSQSLPGAVTVRGSNPRTDASAIVAYAGRPWGVQLYVQVNGVPAGTQCSFDVTDASGQESKAASWTVASGDEAAWYAASSFVPLANVRGFIVTAGAQTLVRIRVPITPTSTDHAK